MTRKKITLRNNFHNTSVRVFEGELSPETCRRVRKALCGVEGCKCGDNGLNTRGPQDCEIEALFYKRNQYVYKIVVEE
jgi:hypothetical protein